MVVTLRVQRVKKINSNTSSNCLQPRELSLNSATASSHLDPLGFSLQLFLRQKSP